MSSRVEDLINAFLTNGTVDFTPHSRMEEYLMACINGTGTEGLPVPMSRVDILLYELAEKVPGGGGVSSEDVATDEEVNDLLEEIFGSEFIDSEIATNEEVNALLNEIFN